MRASCAHLRRLGLRPDRVGSETQPTLVAAERSEAALGLDRLAAEPTRRGTSVARACVRTLGKCELPGDEGRKDDEKAASTALRESMVDHVDDTESVFDGFSFQKIFSGAKSRGSRVGRSAARPLRNTTSISTMARIFPRPCRRRRLRHVVVFGRIVQRVLDRAVDSGRLPVEFALQAVVPRSFRVVLVIK
jgi:hypothetical protein